MDYLQDAESIAQATPGSYDHAAIKFLYGLSPDLPTQPFCTDEHTLVDPSCARFDVGANPLDEYHYPQYASIRDLFLELGFSIDFFIDYYSAGVLGFVRGTTSPTALHAWELVGEGIRF